VSRTNPVKTALTIAGSDPSGGAGIQADLKTFSRLRVYGMAVIAAMTAQNTRGVAAVSEVAPDFVAQQLEAVFSDIRPGAVKTGMLLTSGVIQSVAQKLKQYGTSNLVVDPVMVSTSGATLMQPDAMNSFRCVLLPLAFLITPNIHEAEALTGKTIRSMAQMEEAAVQIYDTGPRNVLIKGGHSENAEATDVLFDGKTFLKFRAARIPIQHTHGTGCVFSAAITAYLALGEPIQEAVRLGKEFVTNAIRQALQIGSGAGPCDPLSLRG
jgi:hydroxymethylpyrimidine/phosphomethylpyrimidine kinase